LASNTFFFIDDDNAILFGDSYRIDRAGIQAKRDRTLMADIGNKPSFKGVAIDVESCHIQKDLPGFD
jgi:hypothetical protein